MQKRLYVLQGVRQDYTDLIIRDFQGIKCGIRLLIQEQDMLWGFLQEQK